MRYQSLTIVVIVMTIAFIVIDSSNFLQRHIIALGDAAKLFILDTKDSIALSYDKYINQAKKIQEYEERLKNYEQLELELLHTRNELDALAIFDTQQAFINDARFSPARAYSYVSMGEYNRVWIKFDVSNYAQDKIFGLVQDNKAIGIAVVHNGALMGLLNGERKSSYSVFIGDEKIPAIVHASTLDHKYITADFIPSWRKVEVGDLVVTSGLDGIFIEGISVGEVVSINHDFGYISAEIKPYAQRSKLGYLWLVDTLLHKQSVALDLAP